MSPIGRHRSDAGRRADVTLVVVGHNGSRWVGEVAAGIRTQTRAPERTVVVDTGSTDRTGDELAAELPSSRLVRMDRTAGFGAAVAAGVAAADATTGLPRTGRASAEHGPDGAADHRWIWLLHDDCVPAPEALAALLAHTENRSEIGVVGPKVTSWTEKRGLLEVGLTIARSGRRETGLEPDEQDQGQHDDVRRMLAVGSAGMLVRRDVWDQLGGFDPRLPLFRDDVDLGWRANLAGHHVEVAPDAIVRHVQASTVGRRTIDAAARRRHLLDRRSALYVLLANLPAAALWVAYPRLVLASLARALGFGLGKLPGLALDELAALALVLARPDVIWRARQERRALRIIPAREVGRLLAPWGAQLGRAMDSVLGVFTPSLQGGADIAARGHRAARAGSGLLGEEDTDAFDERSRLAWLTHPSTLLATALLVLTLVAARDLVGAGRLLGGALLPAPDGAGDLWRTYGAAWHDVGLGSDEPAPPYLPVVAALATLLLGKAPLAVDVLLVGAVPLAGLTALVASRRLLRSRWLQVWAAGTYALVPATTGAVAGGRLGTAVATVLLPLIALQIVRTFGDGRRGGSWSSAWAAGLVLAVAAAFVPITYPLVVVLLAVVAVAAARAVAVVGRFVVVIAVAPVLLLPWTLEVPARPTLLLLEAGLPGPGLSDSQLDPTSVLLQTSGGPGAMPWWLGTPLLLGALTALVPRPRRRLVLAAWLAAGLGLVAGIAESLVAVSTPVAQTAVAAWPGVPVAFVSAGLLLASAVSAERARERLLGRSFGWRQPVALVVVALAALAPLGFAGWWVVRGADQPLERRDPTVLPAFVTAASDDPARPRTVVLGRGSDASIRYGLVRAAGPRLGDAETAPPYSTFDALDNAVADVVSGRGGDQVQVLAEHAVQYLLVVAPVDKDLVARVDSVPGLRRLSTDDESALWTIVEPAARLRLVDSEADTIEVLPAGLEDAVADVAPGSVGRAVVLAELADARWRATLNGVDLEPDVGAGWAQRWAVPAEGGHLVVTYDRSQRSRWLAIQGGLLGLALLLALPGARPSTVAL